MPSNTPLTLTSLLRMVRGEASLPSVDGTDTSAMGAAHDFVVDAVSAVPVYGRSTGVGANKSVELDESNSIAQDLRLLRSHATGAGERLDDTTVELAMIIRHHQLLGGGSGISPDVIPALRALIEGDARPVIHAVGSLGTGDLSQMAELALTLLGEQPLSDGQVNAFWRPHGGDALPFLSSNAFTVATTVRACRELDNYVDHAVRIAAATMRVAAANLEPFAAAVQDARPQPGQPEAAARILAVIGDKPWEARRLQDSFGFRALTPVLAALLTARHRLAAAIEVEMNSRPENPLIDLESERVYHNGNFHTQQLTLDLEAAVVALFGTAQLSFARTLRLAEPEITGQKPFLCDPTPGSSGAMMVEYVAASALNRLRIHAQPASLATTVVSRGTEDHAPHTAQAAQQLLAALSEARRILAVELLVAGRGLALTEPGPTPAPYLDYIEQAPVSRTMVDRPLTEDIAALEEFVAVEIETLTYKDTTA